MFHGFLRTAAGVLITFDAPGAGGGEGTLAHSINAVGAITGYFSDAGSVYHGFLRTP